MNEWTQKAEQILCGRMAQAVERKTIFYLVREPFVFLIHLKMDWQHEAVFPETPSSSYFLYGCAFAGRAEDFRQHIAQWGKDSDSCALRKGQPLAASLPRLRSDGLSRAKVQPFRHILSALLPFPPRRIAGLPVLRYYARRDRPRRLAAHGSRAGAPGRGKNGSGTDPAPSRHGRERANHPRVAAAKGIFLRMP